MWIVTFEATLTSAALDADSEAYLETASRLREIAQEMGCRHFNSVTEHNREITVSIWESEADIQAWKAQPEHQTAQQTGRERWYQDYSVLVASVERQYAFES